MAAKVSPLKQVRRPEKFTTKFVACIDQLFGEKAKRQLAAPSKSFFAELLCLPVERERLAEAIRISSEADLLGNLQPKIQSLFRFAVHELRKGKDGTKTQNAADILLPLLREILAKAWSNASIDVLVLLAGSLDRSDHVFSEFVAAIDETLNNTAATTLLRQRTLQIALIFVASAGQGSVNAYMLRRDLFSGLAKNVCAYSNEPDTSRMAATLIGLLGNFRKFETKNRMLGRLEDLVDDQVMRAMMTLCSASLLASRKAYTNLIDDSPPTFVASLTTFLNSIHLSDVFRTIRPATLNGANGGHAETDEEMALKRLPPPVIATLLPLYSLAHSNKAFCLLMMNDVELTADIGPFLSDLMSFCSYLFCHAATSLRARLYSRLCLFLLLILVEEGAGSAKQETITEVRLCRQRQPMLPYRNDQRRPILCSVLDCLLIFVRHNLRKKIDIESYLCALMLLHRCMHQLKCDRNRLDYDWTPTFRGLLSLAEFIVLRQSILADLPNLSALQDQILVDLDFACVWGEAAFFSDVNAGTALYYEILRSTSVLTTLCRLASKTAKKSADNLTIVIAQMGHALATSADKVLSSKPPSPAVTNGDVASLSSSFEDAPLMHDAAEVWKIIASHSGQLSLDESAALEDIRPFSEAEHRIYFNELFRICAEDAITTASS